MSCPELRIRKGLRRHFFAFILASQACRIAFVLDQDHHVARVHLSHRLPFDYLSALALKYFRV